MPAAAQTQAFSSLSAVRAVLVSQPTVTQFIALDALGHDVGGLPLTARALAPKLEAEFATISRFSRHDRADMRVDAMKALARLELAVGPRMDPAQRQLLRAARQEAARTLPPEMRRNVETSMISWAKALGLPSDPGSLAIDPPGAEEAGNAIQVRDFSVPNDRKPLSPNEGPNMRELAASLRARSMLKPAGDRQKEIAALRAVKSEIGRASWNVLSAARDRHATVKSLKKAVLDAAERESERLATLNPENGPDVSYRAHSVVAQIGGVAKRLARESRDVESFRAKLLSLAEHVKTWAHDRHATRPPLSDGGLFAF